MIYLTTPYSRIILSSALVRYFELSVSKLNLITKNSRQTHFIEFISIKGEHWPIKICTREGSNSILGERVTLFDHISAIRIKIRARLEGELGPIELYSCGQSTVT
jgi:hypothetical protein